MTLSLDHVVIRVRDLEQTIADYSALGFTVQRGGTHADGKTHNALIGFEDGSYFELIAFLCDAPEHRWWDEGNRAGDGLVDFALLPESVQTVVDGARQRGLSYEGPIDGGRVRPDGERLVWQLGKPATPDLPFLCGDITPRHLRVAEGEVRNHPNGARGISALKIAVRDLDTSVGRYRALLGEPLQIQQSAFPDHGVSFASFSIGATTLTLLTPSGGTTGAALAAQVENRLALRGEGVFGIVLHGAENASPRLLPLDLTHGVDLELLSASNAELA